MLPACEPAALRSGHALHRGPHRGYSDVVAARVAGIRAHFALQAPADIRAARRTAVMRLRLLQATARGSEERRVGTECVSTCCSRGSPEHYKQNKSSI